MLMLYYTIGMLFAIAWAFFVKIGGNKSIDNKLNGALEYIFEQGGLALLMDITPLFFLSVVAAMWFWPIYVFYLVFVTVLWVIDCFLY